MMRPRARMLTLRLPKPPRSGTVALTLTLMITLAVAGTGMLAVSYPAHAIAYVASIDPPRGFGYTLGDVVTERVLLAAAGHEVRNVEQPSSGRIDLWLERRPARVETDREGRRWLVLDYQIVNAPRSLTQIALPALSLRTRGGDVLQLGAWPVTVGPIISDTVVAAVDIASAGARAAQIVAAGQGRDPAPLFGASPAMQPDRGASPIPLAPIMRRIGYALVCLFSTLAGWLGWWVWRNRRDAAQLPFARGWRRMRTLCASRAPAEVDADAAWHIVHRALNETAGQVINMHTLSRLFARAPWLLSMQPQLEAFHERSDARFFAVSSGPAGLPCAELSSRAGSDAALVALLRTLFRAERRRHR